MEPGPPRTALVTGANRGIGLAIASRLAGRNDLEVLAAARSREDAEAAAEAIGSGTAGVELDLADPEAAEAAARGIEERFGPVDILVNNAGVLVHGDGCQAGTPDLSRSLAVNAVGPFALIRVFAPGMKARGWGRIVNVSSVWGSFAEGLTGPTSYSVSKAALNALTLCLAPALAPEVKINAACPGWVRTRMGGDAAARSPEEGADTPAWLATLPDDGPTGGFFRDRRLIDW